RDRLISLRQLEDGAFLARPAIEGGAKEIAGGIDDKAAGAAGTGGIIKGRERGDGLSAAGKLKDGAKTIVASVDGGAKEVAVGVHDQCVRGGGPTRVIKCRQNGDRAGSFSQLEDATGHSLAVTGQR